MIRDDKCKLSSPVELLNCLSSLIAFAAAFVTTTVITAGAVITMAFLLPVGMLTVLCSCAEVSQDSLSGLTSVAVRALFSCFPKSGQAFAAIAPV